MATHACRAAAAAGLPSAECRHRRSQLRASRLNIDEQAIAICSIAQATLPGRFKSWKASRQRVIFDVAHNPHAAEYLTGRLKMLPKKTRARAG